MTKDMRYNNKTELMTHLVIGYPSFEENLELLELMQSKGVGQVELQIPFSDPIADGPTIYDANQAALTAGVSLAHVFKFVEQARQHITIPLYFVCYFNTIVNFGIPEFCSKARELGITGLIVPDYNVDQESREGLIAEMHRNELKFIPLITPNSSAERMKQINSIATDMIYCVARLGITGNETKMGKEMQDYLSSLRANTDKRLALGFGIRSGDKIRSLAAQQHKPDIFVVGSQIIKIHNLGGLPAVSLLLDDLLKA